MAEKGAAPRCGNNDGAKVVRSELRADDSIAQRTERGGIALGVAVAVMAGLPMLMQAVM